MSGYPLLGVEVHEVLPQNWFASLGAVKMGQTVWPGSVLQGLGGGVMERMDRV